MFQKLDYDQSVFNLINKIRLSSDHISIAQFLKDSFQIVAKADGEIQDINIQESKFLEDNQFMDT